MHTTLKTSYDFAYETIGCAILRVLEGSSTMNDENNFVKKNGLFLKIPLNFERSIVQNIASLLME
jgi:hypothetical protein